MHFRSHRLHLLFSGSASSRDTNTSRSNSVRYMYNCLYPELRAQTRAPANVKCSARGARASTEACHDGGQFLFHWPVLGQSSLLADWLARSLAGWLSGASWPAGDGPPPSLGSWDCSPRRVPSAWSAQGSPLANGRLRVFILCDTFLHAVNQILK